jgi:hypothetical protein
MKTVLEQGGVFQPAGGRPALRSTTTIISTLRDDPENMRALSAKSKPGRKDKRPTAADGGAVKNRRTAPEEAAPINREQLQAELLSQITHGARLCADVETKLSQNPAPELETLIKLYRVLILKFSLEAEVAPALFRLANDLMKPVLDWARLQEKRKERELAEQKYRDLVEAQKVDREQRARAESGADGLTPQTVEKIHSELSLL